MQQSVTKTDKRYLREMRAGKPEKSRADYYRLLIRKGFAVRTSDGFVLTESGNAAIEERR